MNGILLVLISLFAIGQFQTAHPQVIEVQEGENVTIKCLSHPTISLEKYTLDVKRADINSTDLTHVIYSRRHGKEHSAPQMEKYRNRVFLNKEDLRMGVVTVEIHSVQQSDSGLYKCFIPRLRSTSSFSIIVKHKRNRIEETDFTTMATLMEETTDAGETGAAPTKHHHHHHRVITIVVPIAILCLLVGVVFLVLFKKGICMSRKGSGGTNFELETLNVQAWEGAEEGQLRMPSAGGVGELAG